MMIMSIMMLLTIMLVNVDVHDILFLKIQIFNFIFKDVILLIMSNYMNLMPT
jgi:hypothetical protein